MKLCLVSQKVMMYNIDLIVTDSTHLCAAEFKLSYTEMFHAFHNATEYEYHLPPNNHLQQNHE